MLAITLLVLHGCANWDGYRASMRQQWIGKPIDEVIREFGVPTGRIVLSDGSQILEFNVRANGGYRCEHQFTADPRGKVVATKHGGQNGCITPGA